MYGHVLNRARRHDDAIATARTALAMQPNLEYARNVLLRSLFDKGMHDEWLAGEQEQIARDPELVEVFEQGLAEDGQTPATTTGPLSGSRRPSRCTIPLCRTPASILSGTTTAARSDPDEQR
jgi:hypothetical protein